MEGLLYFLTRTYFYCSNNKCKPSDGLYSKWLLRLGLAKEVSNGDPGGDGGWGDGVGVEAREEERYAQTVIGRWAASFRVEGRQKTNHLKGIPSKGVSWPGNLENVQLFLFVGFVWPLCRYLSNGSTFFGCVFALNSGCSHAGSFLIIFFTNDWMAGERIHIFHDPVVLYQGCNAHF